KDALKQSTPIYDLVNTEDTALEIRVIDPEEPQTGESDWPLVDAGVSPEMVDGIDVARPYFDRPMQLNTIESYLEPAQAVIISSPAASGKTSLLMLYGLRAREKGWARTYIRLAPKDRLDE